MAALQGASHLTSSVERNPILGHDEAMMRLALHQAQQALEAGEIPVGAVLVRNGQVVGAGHNLSITQCDPSAHAEIVALRCAGLASQNYRLEDCTLYVTLEPCAMCAGAILHARLDRVVFGAADPKTGAAGSVTDLFSNTALNHQTRVVGGVLEDQCSKVLTNFFDNVRNRQRARLWPLREDAVRTPQARFADLQDYPWQARYLDDLPTLAGLRLHYLDEGAHSVDGPVNGASTYLCLHGNPAWSYLYRKMIPVWTQAGHRVVAPDLIGFGKSDKPKHEAHHQFDFHRQYLLELVERLDLNNVVLVVQDWGGLLGLTLPLAQQRRYAGVLVMNTQLATGDAPLPDGFLAWRKMCEKSPHFDIARLFQRGNPQLSEAECAAYAAPFPDAGHRAALRAFPRLVPDHPEAQGAAISRLAREFWREQWAGKSLMAVGAADPVFGLETMMALRQLIRNCPQPLVLPQAGHFVQEYGACIARKALDVFSNG